MNLMVRLPRDGEGGQMRVSVLMRAPPGSNMEDRLLDSFILLKGEERLIKVPPGCFAKQEIVRLEPISKPVDVGTGEAADLH